jgi:UDP-N-acetylglucosamine 2-epimerase (non-hydrolysing)
MKLILVVGTRSQIIKSVPTIYEANKRGLRIEIVHTGQHYDALMSDIFFKTSPFLNLLLI